MDHERRTPSTIADQNRSTAVVEPDTGTCEMLDFRRLDEMIDAGRQAALRALSDDTVGQTLTI
jgi:predicted acylesterase/phospholipase RssA